jgi:FixJ family two-component response regulator
MTIQEGLLVAIVDDDDSVRRSVSNLLRSAGFPTIIFDSAESFLASGLRPNTACLVLDLRLQGMSGLDLLQELGPDSPIRTVVLTAHDTEDFRRQALTAGAAAFLAKPPRAESLVSAVRAATDPTKVG